jgi:hypothetical protein
MANKWAKIVAWIALFCIIISVVWTGILFIVQWTINTRDDVILTPEDLQKLIWTGTTTIEETIPENSEQTQTWVELPTEEVPPIE